ncbi:MAG: hypothetical protein J6Q27_03235 [Clostridia bacterium]|nr:hypothetical protein [Clostridia bacterium]
MEDKKVKVLNTTAHQKEDEHHTTKASNGRRHKKNITECKLQTHLRRLCCLKKNLFIMPKGFLNHCWRIDGGFLSRLAIICVSAVDICTTTSRFSPKQATFCPNYPN